MRRVAAAIAGLAGWSRRGTAFLAGALSVLALAPFRLWYVLFFTFPVLVWLIDGGCAQARDAGGRAKAAGAVGWFFGAGYFLFGLYWIGYSFLVEADMFAWLLPVAVLALPAGLALFHAAGAALAGALWRPGLARMFALTLGFSLAEIARGNLFTGLPWNTFGYALTASDAMMQWAALFGAYGLTFIALALFAAPAAMLEPGRGSSMAARLYPMAMLCVLAGGWAWGKARLDAASQEMVPGVSFRVVQPNIPQSEKWVPENAAGIFRTYLAVSRDGPAGAHKPLDGVTHVIWPESSLPFLLADSTEALSAIDGLLPDATHLILGQARAQDFTGPDGKLTRRAIFNSVFVMDGQARITDVYDKLHLVPFGEYLPFQSVLETIGLEQLTRVRGGFTPGAGRRFIASPGTPPFVPLICYEAIFPHGIRPEGAAPKWLLNVTNDAWFGDSLGPYQHLQQTRVRAVEQGLPVIRAANTGISAVVDAYGRIVASLPLGTQGAIDSGLPVAAGRTLFVRAGYWIETMFALLFALAWAVGAYATRTRD